MANLTLDTFEAARRLIPPGPTIYYLTDELNGIYYADIPGSNPDDCIWFIPPDLLPEVERVAEQAQIALVDMREYQPTEAEQRRVMQLFAKKMRDDAERRLTRCSAKESSFLQLPLTVRSGRP